MLRKNSSWIFCAALAFAGNAFAQAQPGVQGNVSSEQKGSVSADKSGAAANIASGSEANVKLTKPVDVGKNKVGDEVTATLSQDIKSGGKVAVPKGSKVIGHVTAAQVRGKGEAESKLGLVFDRAVLKDGHEVPLNATVQAIASSAASANTRDMDLDASGVGSAAGSAGAGGGGLVGGAAGAVGGVAGSVAGTAGNVGGTVNAAAGGAVGAVSRSPGAVGGIDGAGRLTSGSKGVFGLNGLKLDSATAGSAQGSVIASTTRNVRLDSGTNLLLVTGAQAK